MTTMRHVALVALTLALSSPTSIGLAQESAAGSTESPAAVVTDLDALAERAPTTDPSEPAPQETPEAPLPGVPDAPNALVVGELLLRPQLESRARGELRFASPLGGADAHFVTMRNRLGMDARWRDLRVLLQIQDARELGTVDPTASSGASTGVHQGYLQLGDEFTFLRIGRQEIDWGSQRFLGALNWTMPARSFDAIRARTRHDVLSLDVFGAWVRTSRTIADPRTGTTIQTEGDWLAGVSATFALAPLARLELYALYRHDGPTEAPATVADPGQVGPYLDRQRNIVSPGVRLESDGSGPFRYELELVAQAGRAANRDHLAFAAVGEAHYRFVDSSLLPSVGGGLSYGTGAASDVSELDNFYPTNHARYGSADLIGLRNQAHGFVRAGLAPTGTNVELWADVHVLALAEPGARWSDAIGRTIAHDPTNLDRFLGTELDLEVRWKPDPHVAVWGGYAVFLPGSGAARLARPDIMHWAYASVGLILP